jgi:hypothetical protein
VKEPSNKSRVARCPPVIVSGFGNFSFAKGHGSVPHKVRNLCQLYLPFKKNICLTNGALPLGLDGKASTRRCNSACNVREGVQFNMHVSERPGLSDSSWSANAAGAGAPVQVPVSTYNSIIFFQVLFGRHADFTLQESEASSAESV